MARSRNKQHELVERQRERVRKNEPTFAIPVAFSRRFSSSLKKEWATYWRRTGRRAGPRRRRPGRRAAASRAASRRRPETASRGRRRRRRCGCWLRRRRRRASAAPGASAGSPCEDRRERLHKMNALAKRSISTKKPNHFLPKNGISLFFMADWK